MPVKGNCVKYWEKNREHFRGILDVTASLNERTIFLVAAGPLSNIIIFHMWNVNRNNIYLDIGSALDPVIFDRASRGYHKAEHPDRKVVDKW